MGSGVPILPKKKLTDAEPPPPAAKASTSAGKTRNDTTSIEEGDAAYHRGKAEEAVGDAVTTSSVAPWMFKEYDRSLSIADEGKVAKLQREEKLSRQEAIRKFNYMKSTKGVSASEAAGALGKEKK